jgi:hypothetical protein
VNFQNTSLLFYSTLENSCVHFSLLK